MSEKLEREVFGTTKDGETVYRVEIKGGGLTAKIMTWGAVIQDLRLDGHGLQGFDARDALDGADRECRPAEGVRGVDLVLPVSRDVDVAVARKADDRSFPRLRIDQVDNRPLRYLRGVE